MIRKVLSNSFYIVAEFEQNVISPIDSIGSNQLNQ